MRFAVKRLTRSDLTFFEAQYRRQNAGNQKSINLNRDVFIDELYPELPEIMAEGDGGVEVRLRVSGPGAGHRDVQVVRKIIKNDAYKNYRLNGEFVRNPEDAAERFDALEAGDLALLVFEGAAKPKAVRLFVVSAGEPDDAALHGALDPLAGRSMGRVGREALAAAIRTAPPQHPVHDLFLEPDLAADLSAAAVGDSEAVVRLLRRPGRRRVSAEQLARARRAAERIGRDGESLIDAYLQARVASGELGEAEWAAWENAISPFDFQVRERGGEPVRVEVKSTAEDHARPFHVSMAELLESAIGGRYDLYRVSRLQDDGGVLRISHDLPGFAATVIAALASMPAGVRPDGFTVDPQVLTWSEPVRVERPDEDPDLS